MFSSSAFPAVVRSRLHSNKDKHILWVFFRLSSRPPSPTWITATICAQEDCTCFSKIKYRCNKRCAVTFRCDPSLCFCQDNDLFRPIGHFANKKPFITPYKILYTHMCIGMFPSMKSPSSSSSSVKGWDVMTMTPESVRLADPDKTVYSYTWTNRRVPGSKTLTTTREPVHKLFFSLSCHRCLNIPFPSNHIHNKTKMKHRCGGNKKKRIGVCLLGLGFHQQPFRNNSSCKVFKKLGTLFFCCFLSIRRCEGK